MAETYGPFFSGAGDTFNETQWREFFGNMVSPGVVKSGKVNGSVGQDLAITTATGMNVTVGTGLAFAYGFFYENDASLTKGLNASDATLNRIDYIVIELNFTARTVLATVVTGTAASSPTAPALTQNATTWMIPLAQIYVGAGVSSINSGNITDHRSYTGSIPPSAQGSGSGLNADTIDGLDSTVFVQGSSASQHLVVLNRTPTNSDGVDGDLIFQW